MKKQQFISLLKYLPFAICLLLIICYLGISEEVTVQTILDYTPDNLLAAALILLFMYALKSITIVFPIIILEVAVGHLFTTVPAIIINTLGIVIGYIISYWIGHFSGTDAVNKLLKKYPAFEAIVQKQSSNSSFMCFFLRTLFILPGDAVSIYLGAVKTPFGHYLIASTLGSLPSTILATLFGASITEPTSPMFWISILLMTLFAISSLLIYYFYKRKSQKDSTLYRASN